jgi:hypothetical protein
MLDLRRKAGGRCCDIIGAQIQLWKAVGPFVCIRATAFFRWLLICVEVVA